ncbi:D-alanyl-D-alanine carboxypeptidase family protein [Patescibacteria group bacterium]|nr:D-alanyl-D-alanine carboxypeptidase family protein [Patescibacteria group bacterium]
MTKNQIIAQQLEKSFISREKLIKFPVADNGEPLVDLQEILPLFVLASKPDVLCNGCKTIFVRQAVAHKLKKIAGRLNKQGLKLKIVDGYRFQKTQQLYWEQEIKLQKRKRPRLSKREIERLADIFVASPQTAFHPTGGAVDVTLVNQKTNRELWLGSRIGDSSVKSYSLYPCLSPLALANRQILFKEMARENFYNLPSEWWHFSYGAKDWAIFYNKKKAIYDQIKDNKLIRYKFK